MLLARPKAPRTRRLGSRGGFKRGGAIALPILRRRAGGFGVIDAKAQRQYSFRPGEGRRGPVGIS